MSRCFPYPPPGYVRTPVAVAVTVVETTAKLQRERERAEKKEKRNEKKALQVEGGEASKKSKRAHKKRKHEDIAAADLESKKVPKESVSLEKSGLSEEHGAPIQVVHGSPESSQDSSKRRKVVLPSSSQNKNGNILRIKIRRDQDSPSSVVENSRIPETKGMINSAAPVQQRVNLQPPAVVLPRVDLPTTAKDMQRVDPGLSSRAAMGIVAPAAKPIASVDPAPAKSTPRVDSAPAKSTPRVDSAPSKAAQRVNLPPTGVLQRGDTQLPSKVLQKETGTAFRLPVVQHPPLPENTVAPGIKLQQTDPKEGPSISGRSSEAAAAVPELKYSKSDRKKIRKSEKKERKFKDLFVTWHPPSLEMEDMDVGDQDWLLDTTKPNASMSDCRASEGLVQCQSMEQQFSLQTRATYLSDLHIYQLPYVVPF